MMIFLAAFFERTLLFAEATPFVITLSELFFLFPSKVTYEVVRLSRSGRLAEKMSALRVSARQSVRLFYEQTSVFGPTDVGRDGFVFSEPQKFHF